MNGKIVLFVPRVVPLAQVLRPMGAADADGAAAKLASLIDSCIARLPDGPRRRCDRAKIQAVLDRFGCSDTERLEALLLRDDTRKALKEVAPMILVARLQMAVMPRMVPGKIGEPPPGSEQLRHEPLPDETRASVAMRRSTRVATVHFAVPPNGQGHLRPPRLICGDPPEPKRLQKMAPLYSCERSIYPEAWLSTIGLKEIVFCTELSYDGQSRRDVPDILGGQLFIDVGDVHGRRSRHAFHHELWHMADWKLRGRLYEVPEPEWQAHNPEGFEYGFGGKFMRELGTADPPSAPSEHFLNAYSTSSIAEDKAEVWAALMCYDHALKSEPLRAKANILKRRARELCPELDDAWWALVHWHQLVVQKEWERFESVQGKPFWQNWVTGKLVTREPYNRVGVEDLRAIFTKVGLEKYTEAFEAEGYEDLAFLHSMSTEDHRMILGEEMGLSVEEACRLLAALDELLLVIHPSCKQPLPLTID